MESVLALRYALKYLSFAGGTAFPMEFAFRHLGLRSGPKTLGCTLAFFDSRMVLR